MEKELPEFPSETIAKLNTFYSHKEFTILDKRNFSSAIDIIPFLKQGMPVIYRPGFKFDSSVELLERICMAIGKATKVNIRYGNFHIPEEYAFNRQVKLLELNDYLNNFFLNKSKEYHYLGNHEVSPESLKILNIESPNIYDKKTPVVSKIWIGEKGCITPLHCDGSDNFVYQTYGSKKWTLIPPIYHDCLYINLKAGYPPADFWVSNINLKDLDNVKYVKFQSVQKFEILVNPGEGLFIPYGWFHYVETLEDSVMLNFWEENGYSIPLILKNI